MGICQSNLSETDRATLAEVQENQKLDKEIHQVKQAESKVVKLLLLGTGESGKSTIFKQMQILYTNEKGFTDHEKVTYRHVVRRNVVESMQTLLYGAARFGFRLDPEVEATSAKFLLAVDPLAPDFWQPQLVNHITTLWRQEAIKKSFEARSKLQLLDSAEYLFSEIGRIGEPNYMPITDDILKARLRTSGIVERTFKINDVDFKFIDVGGQRNERRKWIHCFEGVTSVIFVAAISEYDQVLYEDEKENRLLEALKVFENIVNNKYFSKTPIILFLNKIDLFRDKLPRVPLRNTFSDYDGDNSYDSAVKFISQKFEALNKQTRRIFAQPTCATETDNVRTVFEVCRRHILRKNLEKLGLA